jgi:hypothetical protein
MPGTIRRSQHGAYNRPPPPPFLFRLTKSGRATYAAISVSRAFLIRASRRAPGRGDLAAARQIWASSMRRSRRDFSRLKRRPSHGAPPGDNPPACEVVLSQNNDWRHLSIATFSRAKKKRPRAGECLGAAGGLGAVSLHRAGRKPDPDSGRVGLKCWWGGGLGTAFQHRENKTDRSEAFLSIGKKLQ